MLSGAISALFQSILPQISDQYIKNNFTSQTSKSWGEWLTYSSVASFLVLGGGQDPQMYRQKKRSVHVAYNCASERAPQKHTLYIFSGLKIHLHIYIAYTINAVPFYYLRLWRYKQ